MPTLTERLGRTRVRVSADPDGGRCRVHTALAATDPTASGLRPLVLRHDAAGAQVSLVPDGALLLAGDAVEIDVEVDPGVVLEIIEPAGTVAFDMRGDRARWDVRIRLGAGARLAWAGEPFVVAAGADVSRHTTAVLGPGAGLALRETLVLGRHGEPPGRLRQHTVVSDDHGPVLVEDLPLDAATAPMLLGGNRVVSSVLALGGPPAERSCRQRYDLDGGGRLWRRLGQQAHEAELDAAWRDELADLHAAAAAERARQ